MNNFHIHFKILIRYYFIWITSTHTNKHTSTAQFWPEIYPKCELKYYWNFCEAFRMCSCVFLCHNYMKKIEQYVNICGVVTTIAWRLIEMLCILVFHFASVFLFLCCLSKCMSFISWKLHTVIERSFNICRFRTAFRWHIQHRPNISSYAFSPP